MVSPDGLMLVRADLDELCPKPFQESGNCIQDERHYVAARLASTVELQIIGLPREIVVVGEQVCQYISLIHS